MLEWVDYHKSVGFDHVYLWSNDDDPDTLRKAVTPHLAGANPFVTYRHWPVQGQQSHIYEHFLETYVHETEWFSFLDADEFLVFRGSDNVHEFMRPVETAGFDSVYFQWAMFGPNGRIQREAGSLLTGLTRRRAGLDFHTKNLVRAKKVSLDAIRRGNHAGALPYYHFWDDFELPEYRVCDTLGEEITGYTRDFPAHAQALCNRPGYQERILQSAYCAHFQFQSEEDYVRRAARGGNSSQECWERMYQEGRHKEHLAALDEVEDRYLADYWGLRQNTLDMMRQAQRSHTDRTVHPRA